MKRTRPTTRATRIRTRTTSPERATTGLRAERIADPLKPRVAGLLRLARKAGSVVVGIALTREAVRDGRARAIWIADDLAERRDRSLVARWRSANVAIYRGWTKDELGELAGKPAVAVLSVTDPNIAAGVSRIVATGAGIEKERQGGERE